MRTRLFTQPLMLLTVTALLGNGPSGCLGRASEPDTPAADVLRARFPEHAAEVLDANDAFTATTAGFASAKPATTGLAMDLPREGDGAIRLRAAGGFEVRVHERGTAGEGTLAGNAVAYRRAGGTSYWTAADGGAEEWLLLDAGSARDDRPAAVWEIEGATLQQREDAVDLVGEDGAARIRVTAPRAYAAGGRPVGARLVARGAQLELLVDAGSQEVLVDPAWTPTMNTMSAARGVHVMTLLPSGKVLVAGGNSLSAGLAAIDSAEIYDDPMTKTWLTVAPMGASPPGRIGAIATLLPDGTVLVAGGAHNQGSQNSAEIYDPAILPPSSPWVKFSTMNASRYGHAAVLFPAGQLFVGGKVFVTGGFGGVYNKETELYAPLTKTWTAQAPMSAPRQFHTETWLPGGRVFVTGGFTGPGLVLATTEIYTPNNGIGTWAQAASMSTARVFQTATLLPSGRVLVAGGFDGTNNALGAAVYDPVANAWLATPPMIPRWGHTATPLSNGTVLIAGGAVNGGTVTNSVEIYDESSNTWVPGAPLNTSRVGHRAALLQNQPYGQRVLITGGANTGGMLATAEVYNANPLGAACVAFTDCGSGFCVDGVCCNTACGAGATNDCQTCTPPGQVGTCLPSAPGTVCRAAAGICDAAETCNGVSTACPADGFAASTTVCRAATGPCDIAEKCTGASTACPADSLAVSTTVCRAAAGACDIAEKCTGASAACPADSFASATTVCRAAAGTCDVAESCTGASAACPVDSFASATTVCRAAAGACDVAETCPGASAACPPDTKVTAGTVCRVSGGACDLTETCDGASDTCPADGFSPAGTVCRAPAGPCDVAETCDGAAPACPPDGFAPSGTSCNAGNQCTKSDVCQAGMCVAGAPIACTAASFCKQDGTCDPASGCLQGASKPNGTPCENGGVCFAGTCAVDPANTSTTGASTSGAGTGGASPTTTTTSTGSVLPGAGGATSTSSPSSSGDLHPAPSGCGCTTVGASPTSASWLLLGLLALRRGKRRDQHR